MVLPFQPLSTAYITPLGVLGCLFAGQEMLVYVWKKGREVKKYAFYALCFFLMLFPASAPLSEQTIRVGLIQGNIQETWEWREEHAYDIFLHYRSLSQEALKHNVTLLLWPEYALPVDLFQEREVYQQVQAFVDTSKVTPIFGTLKKVSLSEQPGVKHANIALIVTPNASSISFIASRNPFPTETWVAQERDRKSVV